MKTKLIRNKIDFQIEMIVRRVDTCLFGDARARNIKGLFEWSEFDKLTDQDIRWMVKSTMGDGMPFLICAIACVRAVHNKGRSMPDPTSYVILEAKKYGEISTYRSAKECFECLYHNGCSAWDIIKNHEKNRRLVATL